MKKILSFLLIAVSVFQIHNIKATNKFVDSLEVQVIKDFAKNNPKAFAAMIVGGGYVACKVVGSACNVVTTVYEAAAYQIHKELQAIVKAVRDCPFMVTAATSTCVYLMYKTQYEK